MLTGIRRLLLVDIYAREVPCKVYLPMAELNRNIIDLYLLECLIKGENYAKAKDSRINEIRRYNRQV